MIVTSSGVSGHAQYFDLLLICACVIYVLCSEVHTTLLLTGEVELVSVEMFINIDILGISTINISVNVSDTIIDMSIILMECFVYFFCPYSRLPG